MDNRCDLGKWISGEGMKYASMEEYKTLKAEHARFHKAAAEVVRRADAGEKVSEETALGSKTDFSKASVAVVRAIAGMREKAK